MRMAANGLHDDSEMPPPPAGERRPSPVPSGRAYQPGRRSDEYSTCLSLDDRFDLTHNAAYAPSLALLH
jgi:hypothetical protein